MEVKHSEQVKFDDFEQNPNLLNVPMDLVGIIAKIGELKYTNGNINEDTVEILSLRDVHIYDDTFTMVRLILRDHHADNCAHFKVNDVISLKNVKIQKVQNRLVMTTAKNTVIDVNTAAYNVLWLKQWFVHNKKDIVKNNFAQFKNLSMTPAKPKKEREQDATPSTPRESPPAKLLRVSPNNIYTPPSIADKSKADPVPLPSALLSPLSPSSPSPLSSPLNIKSEFLNNNNSLPSKPQENTPNEFVETECANNDNDKRPSDQKEKQAETVEEARVIKEQGETEAEREREERDSMKKQESPDDIKTDVRFETYHTLMHSPFLENDWDEEKDQYLVNFITKNSYNLQNDLVYNKLLIEQPDVFAKLTSAMLKERVFMLSSPRNYLYLMKLCGGDHLTTEKEKDTFLVKVEKLRESMKLIKTP